MFLSKKLMHFWMFLFILLFSLDFLKNQKLLSSIPMSRSSELIGKHLFQ